MQTSPVPINIKPSHVGIDFIPSPDETVIISHIESSNSRPKEGRGAKNPKWGKGPSLQEQALFLQGYNREEYNRLYVH